MRTLISRLTDAAFIAGLVLSAVLIGMAMGLASCSIGYENQNGPRGPERIESRAVWPWPVCTPAPEKPAPLATGK